MNGLGDASKMTMSQRESAGLDFVCSVVQLFGQKGAFNEVVECVDGKKAAMPHMNCSGQFE